MAICFFIGGIETLSLVPLEVHGVSQTSGFWGFMYNFNINTAGFVIVGMFIVTWAVAMAIWRFGRIEERRTSRLQGAGGEEAWATEHRHRSSRGHVAGPDRGGMSTQLGWPWMEEVLRLGVPRFPWLAELPLDRGASWGRHLRDVPGQPGHPRPAPGRPGLV